MQVLRLSHVTRQCSARVKLLGERCGHGTMQPRMKRLLQAPNLALATLWADMLSDAGVAATVQRAYASGIAGEIPMDQSLPEVWVQDAAQHAQGLALLDTWQHTPHTRWACAACGELVEGPFEQCWNCCAMRPAHTLPAA